MAPERVTVPAVDLVKAPAPPRMAETVPTVGVRREADSVPPEIVPPVMTTLLPIVLPLRSRMPAVRRTVLVPKAALAPACKVPAVIVVSPV